MENGKLPYVFFYPRDFMNDDVVQTMTLQEVGAYTILLCRAWHEDPPGTLPVNDDLFVKWLRIRKSSWLKIRENVLRPFTFGEDKRLHQKRMESEYEKACARIGKAKKGASAKHDPSRPQADPKQGPSTGQALLRASDSDSSSFSLKEEEVQEEKPKRATVMMSNAAIKELEQNPAYQSIDIVKEVWKFKQWCETNQKPQSKRRFVNWLNRVV